VTLTVHARHLQGVNSRRANGLQHHLLQHTSKVRVRVHRNTILLVAGEPSPALSTAGSLQGVLLQTVMVPSRPESQVSIDDILEYTSNNEELSPAEEAAQIHELAEEIPADLIPQLFTPEAPVFNQYRGPHPNTNLYAISKAELTARAGHQFVPLALPTAEMLAAATKPEVSELIPQDHPEWQNLRSGTMRIILARMFHSESAL